MSLFEQEKHKDFIRQYKAFQEQFDNLYWKKEPNWYLEFKKYDNEIFKPIQEYQGFYFISNYGRVVSFKRKLPVERRSTMIKGFLAVTLNNFGSTEIHYIHELVYTHFVDQIKAFHQVVHIDNDITNNYYANLQEIDNSEPGEKKEEGKPGDTLLTAGEPGKAAKPPKLKRQRKTNKPMDELDAGVLQFTSEGKFVREFLSIREAALELKIKPQIILDCLKGKSKIAGDSQWLYRADPNFDDGIFDINPVKRT